MNVTCLWILYLACPAESAVVQVLERFDSARAQQQRITRRRTLMAAAAGFGVPQLPAVNGGSPMQFAMPETAVPQVPQMRLDAYPQQEAHQQQQQQQQQQQAPHPSAAS